MAILDLGERFWKLVFRHRGRKPPRMAKGRAGVGAGGGRPSRLGGPGGITPENF